MNNTIRHSTFFLVSMLILCQHLAAQEMTIQAPKTVYVGQQFQVRFDVNDKAKDFQGPTFKGFSVLGGPSTSSSSSMSIINGNVSRSVSTGFTYWISADMEGSFTVGSASCSVEGKRISSKPFTIKVEKGNPQAQQQQRQRGGWGAQQPVQQEQPTEIDSKALFAHASVNKTNPYQGEQIILTYKIYTRVPISQFQIERLPGNKGFWAEDLSEGKDIKQYEETYNGQKYQVAEIRRGALFAQENGNISIEPLDLDVLAMVQRQRKRTGTIWDLFDDPFFNTAQAVEKHLRTNRINVNVKPLPTAPDGFCGGVGNFNVAGDVDTRTVKANEAITYKLTISGNGNLMLINEPSPLFPQSFEVYDPQVNDKINHSDGGINGSRTFEWILIPRNQGDYEIPAFDFVYFDPQKGSYVTKQVPAIPLHIDKGDPNAMRNVSSNQSDVRLLNSDINYIKTRLRLHSKSSNITWFWITLSLILVATIAALVTGSKRQKAQQDIAGTRLRRATREAKKRLKKAEKHLQSGDDNLFYEEIYKAIWGCLSDKFNINLAQLSSETVKQCLAEKQVAPEQQTQILQTLQDVDFARFAPGDSSQKKHSIYDKALNMIRNLTFLLVLTLSALSLNAQPSQLMQKGNDAYKANDYPTAISCYEQILSNGYEAAPLYYNLGNCHYRQNEFALAILNYERALRIDPTDKETRQNLEIANSKIQDKIVPLPKLLFVRGFNAMTQWFSLNGWLIVVLILTALLCAIFVGFRFSNSYNLRKYLLIGGGILLITLLLAVACTIATANNRNNRNEAIVMTPATIVKSSPESSSIDKFELHEGTKVTIEERVGEWYKIAIADGNSGWIATSEIERI